jgi:protocatechuate 3,4-dioxygenase beta subunit
MNRKANLLLLCLIMLVLGGGVFLLLRRGEGGAGEGAGPLSPEPAATAGSSSTEPGPASRTTQDPAGVQREAVAAATKQVGDPEYAAALCGFTGRVLTPAKEPAPKKTVRVYRFDPATVFHEGLAFFGETTMDPRVDVGEGRTGDDGRFTIEGAYPRSTYALVADAAGEVPTFQIIDRSPGAGETCDVGDIVLRNAATLTGTVVDGEGKPVEGALVRALDLPGAVLAAVPVERIDPKGALLFRTLPDSREAGKAVFEFPEWIQRRYEELPIPKATTDGEGKFTVTGVDGGVNCVMVTKPNKSSWVKPAVPVKAGQKKDLGTIKLDEGELVQGRVVDANGKPVVAAEVLLAQTSSLGPVDFALRAAPSDGEGRFSCVGFKPGQVTAAARRSAKDPWTLADPVQVSADVVVRLPALAALTVRATSKQRLPLEGLKIRLYPSKADVPWAILGLLRPIDLAGRLEALEAGVIKVHDVPAGAYRIVADAKGHATAMTLSEVVGEAQATIELVPHATLKVFVSDSGGQPIRRAAVHYTSDRRTRDNMPVHGGTTGDDGVAMVQVPAGGDEIALSADHPRYSKTNKTIKLPAAEVRIVLEAPGSLDGILTAKGQVPELGKYWISVMRRSWDEPGGRAGLPDMGRLAAPDAEGKFKMSGLAPGKYMVNAEPSQSGVHSVGAFYSGMMSVRGWREPCTVMIVSGQTATVTIDTERQEPVVGPSARITGSVLLNGRPPEGLMVQGWSKRSLSATVDAAGRFDLGQVDEGQVTLQLMPAGQRDWRNQLWSSSFKLEANKDKELRIDLQVARCRAWSTAPTACPRPAPASRATCSPAPRARASPPRNRASRRRPAPTGGSRSRT